MGVVVAQGEFQHPDQTAMASVDQYVPAQIPFQPAFLFFSTSYRDGPIDADPLRYGQPDNTDSGDIFRANAVSEGFALYHATPGSVRQFVHGRQVPHAFNIASEHHKAFNPAAIQFYGYNHFILPGSLTGAVHEYTVASSNYDFTIRWAIPRDGVGGAAAFPAGGLVRWFAVGGDDITDVAIANWGLNVNLATSYTQDVTAQFNFGPAIGFKPDFLWHLYMVADPATEAGTFNNGVRHGIGWANCALEQGTILLRDETFNTPTVTKHWQMNDAMIVQRQAAGKFIIRLDEMLDTGGFRVLIENPSAVTPTPEGGITTLCVKGLSSKISRVLMPAGTVETSGVNPVALLTLSCGEGSTTDLADTDRISYGLYTDSGQWCVASDFPHGQSFTPVAPFFLTASGGSHTVDFDGSVIAKLMSPTGDFLGPGAFATVEARATATGFDSLTWDDTDGSDMEVLTCVLGSGGGGTCEGPIGTFAGTWVDTQMVPVFA